ncbi:MAG: hypothetical protein K2K70_09250 [Lachnospiraceae bacterium]|nr:hypothetical protein [Lachnospiraceae bacterium]
MDYFELIIDPSISNPIQIQHIDSSIYKNDATYEEFAATPKMTVGYFDNSPQIEIYDLLGQPAFLVSDNLKRLFALYAPDMQFNGIRVYANNLDDDEAPLYWWPYIPYVECLSDQTTKYPTGMLECLVLDRGALHGEDIFRISGILENKVVISLSVAESMIRRKMTGFTLKPILFAEMPNQGQH